jgi:hypothetical protein
MPESDYAGVGQPSNGGPIRISRDARVPVCVVVPGGLEPRTRIPCSTTQLGQPLNVSGPRIPKSVACYTKPPCPRPPRPRVQGKISPSGFLYTLREPLTNVSPLSKIHNCALVG